MTTTDARPVPPLTHAMAMGFADEEARLMVGAIDGLDDGDWALPTDCEGWDVKALLSHVLGAMEGNARIGEFFRQYRTATRESRRSGRPMIDEMTALQVRDRAALTTDELADRLRTTAHRAVRGRRRIPAPVRALSMRPGPPVEGSWKVGYLVDVIMNRDFWMHRVDLTRATGREMVLTPAHDGAIVAGVVAEWARTHGEPFTLVLEGPAGGTFGRGEGDAELRLDAVEFCRILSGRSGGSGLLSQEVPF